MSDVLVFKSYTSVVWNFTHLKANPLVLTRKNAPKVCQKPRFQMVSFKPSTASIPEWSHRKGAYVVCPSARFSVAKTLTPRNHSKSTPKCLSPRTYPAKKKINLKIAQRLGWASLLKIITFTLISAKQRNQKATITREASRFGHRKHWPMMWWRQSAHILEGWAT